MMTLVDGYDRNKKPAMLRVAPMLAPDALLIRGQFLFQGRDHKVRRARTNGAPKTWATRPNEYRIPIKYGLREYSYIVPRDGIAVIEGTGLPVLVLV